LILEENLLNTCAWSHGAFREFSSRTLIPRHRKKQQVSNRCFARPLTMAERPQRLSSQLLQTWFDEISEQVSVFGVLFNPAIQQQQLRGYYHTLREICQQPFTWLDTADRVANYRDELQALLRDSGIGDRRGSLVLTGSGSSLYVGECLNLVLQQALRVPVMPVPAGLILTHTEQALPPGETGLVVSFGRSGDSPESSAALDLLLKTKRQHRHLVVTCNHSGKLATRYQGDSRILVLLLDDATCDRSLVMTSSFTNMVWAARALGMIESLNEYHETTGKLAQVGKEILLRHSHALAEVCRSEFTSAIYLGSGASFGAARESALKMLEMTAGQVSTSAETFLGVRHGPLTAVLPTTLIVCFLSGERLVRAYELDLIRELSQKNLGMRKVILGEDVPTDLMLEGDMILECPSLNQAGDENATVLYTVVGQLLAFFRCLSLGLKPDLPSAGVIRRVVDDFTIHRRS
jgi:tagatose-6-phosphate ketose/aldose isomerase